MSVVTKYLFGDASKESIIEIPQGQLYLVRPLSPKGYSELIFKDAAASIRRTGQEYQYQLVVQRAYEEGEEELLADEDGDDDAAERLSGEKDEKTFLLDQGLHFRSEIREGGEKVFAWRDLSGDPGDLYEFVCDRSVPAGEVGTFELVAVKCQYERKYRKPNENATEKDLRQFNFEAQPIPSASPLASPTLKTKPPSLPAPKPAVAESSTEQTKDIMAPKKAGKEKAPAKEIKPTIAPPSAVHPDATEVLAKETAELHLFDFDSGAFVLQDSSVVTTVSEIGPWRYWLQITGSKKDWLGQAVVADINPVFNFEYLSFIFNHYTDDGSAYSWLLRFKDQETEERFQEGLMQALWEQLNETKWRKTADDDRQYVLDAFQDLTMEDAAKEGEEEEAEVEEVEDDGERSEHYDTDESEDDVGVRDDDGNINSQLAVGYKHDRSFVVRGSKIGVFKHTPNNNLEFSTNISKVETPGGKLFSPTKVMLHAEDTNMILQNQNDPHSLYRMDLEYGKVVDEWKVHDDIAVKTFAPEKVGLFPLLLPLQSVTSSEILPNDRRTNLPRPFFQRPVPHRPSTLGQQIGRLGTQTIHLQKCLLRRSNDRKRLHRRCIRQRRHPHVRPPRDPRQNGHPSIGRAHHRPRCLGGRPMGAGDLQDVPAPHRRAAKGGQERRRPRLREILRQGQQAPASPPRPPTKARRPVPIRNPHPALFHPRALQHRRH